jgi:hypothetical protein
MFGRKSRISTVMKSFRLVYASLGKPAPDFETVKAILRVSNEHNAAQGISGILCYSSGAFMQVLEGERAAVNRLYNRITRDPRHIDCELLLCGAVENRSFAAWSMKLIELEGGPRHALLMQHFGSQRFEPHRMTEGQAAAFLAGLAELERISELGSAR